MHDTAKTALHQINSGIQDVMSGYETLKERGDVAILPTAQSMEDLHRGHAADVQRLLSAAGEDTDDASLRGTVNKMAVTVRDWMGSLDGDALSFVRQGEEMLLGVYDAALEAWDAATEPDARQTVAMQAQEIRGKVAALPKS